MYKRQGGENTEIFTIITENVPSLTISDWEEYINLAIGDSVKLQTISENGEFNFYMWNIEKLEIENTYLFLNYTGTEDSLVIDWNEWLQGEYLLKVSGRDTETNLWAENFSMKIFVYDNPYAHFEFDQGINEGEWLTFDASKSNGFWNGSETIGEKGLELSYIWTLDDNELAGTDEIITTLIETGGDHIIKLTVLQEPVGTSYYEMEFYADYKPWGIMSTFPEKPRYGEDFELYLNAYDEESEAVIDSLKITAYDFEGNEMAVLLYNDQGANFNVVFEVEYTGTMVLEYQLTDEMGNYRTNISTVEVLGWVDIYVDSIEVKGTKETGKTQTIEFVLKNYNETYQTNIYNGQEAIGTVDLLIEGEVVKTWSYEIKPTESQMFSYEWVSITGIREFEVVAYVPEGEVIVENNNLTTTATFKSERKTGILPAPSIPIVIFVIAAIASMVRRKPN